MTEKIGLIPLEYYVLVLPDPIEDTMTAPGGTKFLVAETEEASKRRQARQRKATLVEVSSNAFEGWEVIPKIGARVMIDQYAGEIVTGDNGVDYRLIKDKEIKIIMKS